MVTLTITVVLFTLTLMNVFHKRASLQEYGGMKNSSRAYVDDYCASLQESLVSPEELPVKQKEYRASFEQSRGKQKEYLTFLKDSLISCEYP